MFRTGSLIIRFVLALLLIGGLVAAGAMLYRSGQAQGYALGFAASGQAVQQPLAPVMPYYPGHFFHPGMFFFPFFPLFGLLFWGFMVFFVFGRLIRHRHWHEAGGHPMHGFHHPWGKDQAAESGQEGAPAQPKDPPTSK